ncbi:MAG: hypothetical protein ACI8QH_001595 [Flammeovirgaceae bacterium]
MNSLDIGSSSTIQTDFSILMGSGTQRSLI